MPDYVYRGPEIVLPDIPLVVSDGDTVTLPDGFYTDDEQAAAVGFVPAKSKSVKNTDAGSEPANADPQL